jgi:hypothetical protein
VTPEETSRALIAEQYEALLAQAELLDVEVRYEEAGDDATITVRCMKPEGRTFVFRLTCDDYPRVAPLLRFINPAAWGDSSLVHDFAREHWPMGEHIAERNKPFPVPCIRGHRDYYEGGWHPGWTIPPHEEDTPYQLVVHIRNAILDAWN